MAMKILRLVFALALLPIASFAGTVLTWDFETGTPSFTSNYTPWALPNANPEMPDGNYAIVTSPQQAHDLWSDFGDHTSGTGNMMVVNSSTLTNQAFWIANWGSTSLLNGVEYELSFWIAEVYHFDHDQTGGAGSPADLWVSVDGVQHGNFLLTTDAGVWNQFSLTFTASGPHPNLSIGNGNTQWQGNDFAIDDISLHQPEPSAWMMGIGGVAAMLLLRRRKRAS
jgi:hypothetical protein